MARRADLVRLEVFHHLFASVAEEMGVSLMRSAFSANIKERRDFSCALFDGDGRMVAQAAHLPVHLGSAPLSLVAVRERYDLEPGDVAIVNDPFQGGTHLPDITLVSPVHLSARKQPDFYCLNRAHHADVGGAFPGSMAPTADVHGEGLRLPPLRLVRAGELDADLLRLILANMRVPREREGDLMAQWAANRVGERRLREMAEEHGAAELRRRARQLTDWTDQLVGDLADSLSRGTYRAEDELEETGEDGQNLRIRLVLSVTDEGLVFDFTGTDPAAGVRSTRFAP